MGSQLIIKNMKYCQHFECCQCNDCNCCCLKDQEEFITSRVYEDAFQKECFCAMKCKACNGEGSCEHCDGGFIGCCMLCRGCIC